MINIITNREMKLNSQLRNSSLIKRNLNINEADKSEKYLFIKVGYSTVKVNFNEIKYIEGLKDYVKIFVKDKSIITKSTIKHAENKLPLDLFTRVHKSYIISIDKIDKIEYNHIFIGEKKIPIGMQFRDTFYRIIDYYRL